MVATLIMDGKRYRLVPEDEYDRLISHQTPEQEAGLPPLPEPGADGLVPAVEYLDASLARKLIRARRRAGLSQAELARRAGIRVETLNRIEKVKTTPTVRTVERIDRILKAAKTQNLEAPGRTERQARRKSHSA
jgi:ribosome-binding protein aMBF1 (putative translation factor)